MNRSSLLLLAPLLAATPLAAQSPSASQEAWRLDPSLERARPLELRRSTLGPAMAELEVELFDGERVTARRVESRESRPGTFTWRGSLAEDAEGYLALSVRDGAVAGVLLEHGHLYRIRENRDGGLVVYACEDASPAGCAQEHERLVPPATGTQTAAEGARSVTRSQSSSAGNTVDILVAWTQEAEDAAGGASAMMALIDLAVVETNMLLDNSGVDLELNLLDSSRVDYVESGSQATDLDRLVDAQDSYLDDVHAWRDAYGADAVSLIVADDSYCGRSFNMTADSSDFTDYAFNLVAWNCATGYYAFAHEFGHIFGLDHDRVNANDTPSQPYAYGFWTPNNKYRTVMGLPRWGVEGTRIPYFSNPALQYQGQVLGIASPNNQSADAARALNDNRPVVTSWKNLNSEFVQVKPACALGRTLLVDDEVALGESIDVVLADPAREITEGSYPVLVLSAFGTTPNCSGYPVLDDMLFSLVLYQVGPQWIENQNTVMRIPLPNVASLGGLDINVQPIYFDLTLGTVRAGNSQTVTTTN